VTARAGRHGQASGTPPVDHAGDPLTFNVAGLLAQPAGSRRDFPIDQVAIDLGDGELRVTQPLDGTVTLTRTNRGLLVEADLRTALAGECRRCLRPVETPIEVRIDEEALPSIDLVSGRPTPLDAGEDAETTRLTDHHELELRPLVHEAITLAEPMDILCEPDCPGLCSVCGERLSPGHEHAEEDVDPRLEVLRSFKVDAPDETG
jgi:uncharacterized protein